MHTQQTACQVTQAALRLLAQVSDDLWFDAALRHAADELYHFLFRRRATQVNLSVPMQREICDVLKRISRAQRWQKTRPQGDTPKMLIMAAQDNQLSANVRAKCYRLAQSIWRTYWDGLTPAELDELQEVLYVIDDTKEAIKRDAANLAEEISTD
jgi:hypothetical protein